METNSNKIYKKAKEQGLIKEKNYIKFKGTGIHFLKFVKDEPFKGKNFRTGKDEEKMRYYFEEDGVEKMYETAIFRFEKDDEGNDIKKLGNFVQSMADFNYGDLLKVEWKPIVGTPRGFIKIEEASSDDLQEDDIPVVEEL